MNSKTKRFLAIVLVCLICIHFSMVFIYCSPVKFESKEIDFISRLYVYPVFHQNWGLFVPAPNEERRLYVRYKLHHDFSNWQDILAREINAHKNNRLAGGEAKVLMFSNSLIYELNSIDNKPSALFSGKQSSKEFQVLVFEVNQYLKAQFKVMPDTEFELLLVSKSEIRNKAYHFKYLKVK